MNETKSLQSTEQKLTWVHHKLQYFWIHLRIYRSRKQKGAKIESWVLANSNESTKLPQIQKN